jgi:hypothetical protein
MVRKSKPLSPPKPSRKKLEKMYPSLAHGPTPEAQLAKLQAQAKERGITPMTSEELERYLEEFNDLWPDEAEIDAFVAWIHRARRTGRYD